MTTGAASPVLHSAREGVATLTLNRPAVHNAVDDTLLAGLETALEMIEGDADVRVVLLTGAGDETFCAGGDLGYFARLTAPDEVHAMATRMRALLARLADGPRPVIAALNGSVYGGGCEILLACHLRLAAAGAVIQFRQAALGMVTGWGGTERLVRLVGPGRALRLLLAGEAVEASAALALGLVDEVRPHADLAGAAHTLAELIARRSPAAVSGFLALVRRAAAGRSCDELESEQFVARWQDEGLQDVLQRYREPRR